MASLVLRSSHARIYHISSPAPSLHLKSPTACSRENKLRLSRICFLDAVLQRMDVDVKFPSPTPFLTRSPVVDSAPPPLPTARKSNKHAPATSKKPTVKTHTVQDGVVAKPKQSKSRNGMSHELLTSIPCLSFGSTHYYSSELD